MQITQLNSSNPRCHQGEHHPGYHASASGADLACFNNRTLERSRIEIWSLLLAPFNEECDDWVCLCLTSRKSRLKSFSKEIQKAISITFLKKSACVALDDGFERDTSSFFFSTKGFLESSTKIPRSCSNLYDWWQVLSLPACPLRSTQGEGKKRCFFYFTNVLFPVQGIFILVHFSGLPVHHDVLCDGKL